MQYADSGPAFIPPMPTRLPNWDIPPMPTHEPNWDLNNRLGSTSPWTPEHLYDDFEDDRVYPDDYPTIEYENYGTTLP